MPITIKQNVMSYKNPSTGQYEGFNAIQTEATATQITNIQTAGATQVAAVNSAGATQVSAITTQGATTLASIPQDYTTLSNDVSDLKSALEVESGTNYISGWTQGWIRDNGTLGSSDTDCYTGKLYFSGVSVTISVKTGYRYGLFEYNADDSLAQKVGRAITASTTVALTNGHYYRVEVGTTDNAAITPSTVPDDAIWYTSAAYTDDTLTLSGKAADSETVGEKLLPVYASAITRKTKNLSNSHMDTLIAHNYHMIALNTYSVGDVVSLTPTDWATNGTSYAIYNCKKGDVFALTGKAGSANRLWAFIDSDDKLVDVSSANANTGDTPITLTAPEDGKLICNVSSRVTPKPTLTHTFNFDNISASVPVVTMSGINSPYYHGPYDILDGDLAGWYEGLNTSYEGSWDSSGTPTGDGFGGYTTYAHVISKYDALMAMDSAYITKNSLGTGSGTDAGGNAYTLYEYVFAPKHYSETLNAKKMPKILLQCCQHGFEKSATYGMYYFLYDLVNNWDKNSRLEYIRNHVEIHVIPVVNPWGFDNRSYLNYNDVNLNRNYLSPNWTYVPTTDTTNSSGDEPFDQPETQIIKTWVESHPDAVFFADVHTNGQYNSNGYNNMNPLMPVSDINDTYYNRCFNAFVREIDMQTAMFPKMYPSVQPGANEYCGRIQSDLSTEAKGTANKWVSVYKNIVGFTLEIINGLVVNSETVIEYMSEDTKKIDSEMIGNVLSALLRVYADS